MHGDVDVGDLSGPGDLRPRPVVADGRQGRRGVRLPATDRSGGDPGRTQTAGSDANAIWPEPGGALRIAPITGRRRQTRAQGRPDPGRCGQTHLPAGADHRGDSGGSGLRRDPAGAGGIGVRSQHPAAVDRPARGGALRAGRYLDRGVWDRAGRLVLRFGLSAVGWPAIQRPGDLLRDRHGTVFRRGVHLRRNHVHLGHRRRPDQHLVRVSPTAVVRGLSRCHGG